MSNRRKLVVALGAGTLTASFGAFAQATGKVWHFGYIGSGTRQQGDE